MGEFPVEITPEAWDQIRRYLVRKGSDSAVLRIGVKGGGCSGYEYLFRAEPNASPKDICVEREGTVVVCDPKSARFLSGARLVYTGNLLGGGFAFENPNATRSCGCGTSFSLLTKEGARNASQRV